MTKNSPANFEQKFQVQQAKFGDSVRLECNASGDQPIKVDWFQEGNQTAIERNGNEFYEIHEMPNEFGLASFMQIRSLNLRDSQLYKCLASNEFGSSEKLIKLIVLNVPERPSNLRTRDIWSRSVLVSWSYPNAAGGPTRQQQLVSGAVRPTNFTVQFWRKTSPSPTGPLSQRPTAAPTQVVQNHRRESLTVDGLQSSALLSNLQPALTYEVSVIAQNQVGQGEASETIQVTTSEEEPSAPPTDVQAESLGGATIRIMWKMPPAETLNGRLLGFYVGYRPRQSSSLMLQPPPSSGSLSNSIQQQQQPTAPAAIYSFKTTDAVDELLYYETFLTNLKHLTEYELTVRAFNKAGSGPDCHVLVARTGLPRLPGPASVQVRKITSNSVSLRWSGPATNQHSSLQAAGVQSQAPFAIISQPLVFELFYQIQGERDWYQLSVSPSGALGQQTGAGQTQLEAELMQRQTTGFVSNGLELAEQLNFNMHTLSNLQAGLTYRIYVAAVNEFGLGDPSNVVTVRTDPPPGPGATQWSGQPGGVQLDASGQLVANSLLSAGSTGGGSLGANLLEALTQPSSGTFYTLVSSVVLVGMLLTLVGYFAWQRRLGCKYNSSAGSSSYPTSWTPAASDTIQSEYSVKRLPLTQHRHQLLPAAAAAASASTSLQQQQQELYDEVECVAQPIRPSQPLGAFQKMQPLEPRTSKRSQLRSATVSRPLLSSHYHQPAALLGHSTPAGSFSATLQFAAAGHTKHGTQTMSKVGAGLSAARHQQFSSTLNRHQNRQLPPIPYGTMSMAGREQTQPNHHQPMQQLMQEQQQQQQAKQLRSGPARPQTTYAASMGPCGSQTPLIYGAAE